MSCASPIQASPPSLRTFIDNGGLLSPRRPAREEPPFSFAFSPSSAAPPATPSRSALADILQQTHRGSPRNALCALSPRKGCKENRGAGFLSQSSNAGRCSPSPGRRTGLVHQPFCSVQCGYGEEDQDFLAKSPKQSAQTPISCRQQTSADAENPHCPPADALPGSPSPSPLRRKRPAKLCIPEFARLSSFNKSKQFELPAGEPPSSEILSIEDPLFAVSFRKGRRDIMEDTYTAITNFQGTAKQSFFGVFDGHGGKSAAHFAAENLSRHIAMAMESQKEGLESAMKSGYLAMDLEFLGKGLDSGACSISAFIKGGHLVVANAGDCKAVLSRDGKAEPLSIMHRPSNAEERQRIESLGGYVDCFNGVWRVQGTLAVTRGFGDSNLKSWISAEPDVRQISITENCEFLILASDGLWDKVSDQEAVNCIRETLEQAQKHASEDSHISRPCKVIRKDDSTSFKDAVAQMGESRRSSPEIDACRELIHKACSRGNQDDITVMVVPLANFLHGSCASEDK